MALCAGSSDLVDGWRLHRATRFAAPISGGVGSRSVHLPARRWALRADGTAESDGQTRGTGPMTSAVIRGPASHSAAERVSRRAIYAPPPTSRSRADHVRA